MKKALFVIALTLFSCSAPQDVRWLRGSFTAALDAARAQQKPILVDFYSDT